MSSKGWFVPTLLTALVVLSAFFVSYSVHSTRQLTHESQQLQRKQSQLHTDWGRLILEHSTWGSYARVERIAREELNMIQPTAEQRVVEKP
ncbi:MAG TPA: cell division protein FtsL [Alcanivoracaceae bacterium]|nr:cell division protein FtsL [Alcanivoracaceae bacterium]